MAEAAAPPLIMLVGVTKREDFHPFRVMRIHSARNGEFIARASEFHLRTHYGA